MQISTADLAEARRIVGTVMDELCLEAYLYEVEPTATGWEIWIECPVAGGWTRVSVAFERDRLLAADTEPGCRAALRQALEHALVSCRRSKT